MVSFRAKHVEELNPGLTVEEEADYVFDIKPSPQDGHKILVSASDMKMRIYDINTFQQPTIVKVHEDRINAISYSAVNPQSFYSGSADCTVKGWDARSTSQAAFCFKMEDEVQALSCNIHDTILAVGVGNDIHFFDLRKAASNSNASMKSCLLGTYSDVHSDMVTQLEFSFHQPSLLLSGAEDGLLVTYDTATAEAEEAVLSILNTDCPVRKVGFFGPNMEGVYALSTVESASFWHYPSAQRLAHYPDIRETLGVEYLIDCCYEQSTSKLQLFTGMYDGNTSFLDIDPSGYKSSGLSLHQHTSTVRCCVPLPFRNPLNNNGKPCAIDSYLTGGEDGKIVYWKKEEVDVQNDDCQDNKVITDGKEGDKFDLVARTELQEQEDVRELEREREEKRHRHGQHQHGKDKSFRSKKHGGNFRQHLRHNPY